MKLMQFRIYFNVSGQVNIVNKKQLLQNVDILSLKSKYSSEMVYQTMHC